MTTATVSKLKASPSEYLRRVKKPSATRGLLVVADATQFVANLRDKRGFLYRHSLPWAWKLVDDCIETAFSRLGEEFLPVFFAIHIPAFRELRRANHTRLVAAVALPAVGDDPRTRFDMASRSNHASRPSSGVLAAERSLCHDLTPTYLAAHCPRTPQAKRGYSRNHRPDCQQVVVGVVPDRDGSPKAHEIFDGHRVDRATVADMLTAREARTGRRGGAAVAICSRHGSRVGPPGCASS